MAKTRGSSRKRRTKETDVRVRFVVDGSGKASVKTGMPFLDHMLELVAVHGLFDLTVKATGDLDVDQHHTVEDLGLVLGAAIDEALGDRKGLVRYASLEIPMDECLVSVALDLGGRPFFASDLQPKERIVGAFDSNLVPRSEEHTSELQSLAYLVCRLLLEKKKKKKQSIKLKKKKKKKKK